MQYIKDFNLLKRDVIALIDTLYFDNVDEPEYPRQYIQYLDKKVWDLNDEF